MSVLFRHDRFPIFISIRYEQETGTGCGMGTNQECGDAEVRKRSVG